MGRRTGSAAMVALAALAAACAPAPKDDGTVLTLPPTTAAASTTTVPPLSLAATIQLRTSGTVKKVVSLNTNTVCVDDRKGTVTVRGAAADGTTLEVSLVNPAAGTFPVAVVPPPASPPPEPQRGKVTNVTLRVGGKEYHRPSGGQITIADGQARRATVVAQAFAEDPSLKMTADWACTTPVAPPPAASTPR